MVSMEITFLAGKVMLSRKLWITTASELRAASLRLKVSPMRTNAQSKTLSMKTMMDVSSSDMARLS